MEAQIPTAEMLWLLLLLILQQTKKKLLQFVIASLVLNVEHSVT